MKALVVNRTPMGSPEPTHTHTEAPASVVAERPSGHSAEVDSVPAVDLPLVAGVVTERGRE